LSRNESGRFGALKSDPSQGQGHYGMTILVSDFACAEEDYNLKAMLLSTTLLMSGFTTLAQVTIGIR
jgi:hypothetical protein